MSNPIEVQLFHHKSLKWTEYLEEYSDLAMLKKQGTISIVRGSLPDSHTKAFAGLPEAVRRLLFFGKPDVVVCIDNGVNPVSAVFALDVTQHVSASDHWMQRFPNLVGCAQEGVPGAFITPGDMPGRPNFTSAAQPAFFYLFDRVIEIHQTPMFIAQWPSTNGSQLDGDTKYRDLPPHSSAAMKRTLDFFNISLDRALKGREVESLMRERLIVELRNELRRIGYQRIPQIGDFKRLTANMPDGRMLTDTELQAWLKTREVELPAEVPDRIRKRGAHLIFTPRVGNETPVDRRAAMLKRVQEKGGDPYGPQPLVFDYLFCRLGPSRLQRDANVVVDLSFFDFADFASWIKKVWEKSPIQELDLADLGDRMPVYAMQLSEPLVQSVKNFVRWHVFAADLLVFRDGVLVL